MASSWWKFSVGTAGTHLVRVTHIGTAEQEVWVDGSPLQAPPGTTIFTGPGACLLELAHTDAGWVLTVDGAPAEVYNPGSGPLEWPAVLWFKFPVQGMGIHHVRVTDIGTHSQAVFLDGAPVEAPPGTMTFTGPAASLLELQRRENLWVLSVDGKVVHQTSPHADQGGPTHSWNFELPSGSHSVRVSRLGEPGQEIYLDGTLIPAPDGTALFTGPGGSLLQLQQAADGSWVLTVDGVPAEAGDGAGADVSEASWTFLAHTTGSAHQLRALNIGKESQEVYLDGTLMPAPGGTTTFTGPGGTLLELRCQGHGWALFVDGVGVEDYNARSSTLPGGADPAHALPAAERRVAADPRGPLPQGVSYDTETGTYKANIKVGGRFKCLGDFATPDEASARYQQAKSELGV